MKIARSRRQKVRNLLLSLIFGLAWVVCDVIWSAKVTHGQMIRDADTQTLRKRERERGREREKERERERKKEREREREREGSTEGFGAVWIDREKEKSHNSKGFRRSHAISGEERVWSRQHLEKFQRLRKWRQLHTSSSRVMLEIFKCNQSRFKKIGQIPRFLFIYNTYIRICIYRLHNSIVMPIYKCIRKIFFCLERLYRSTRKSWAIE